MGNREVMVLPGEMVATAGGEPLPNARWLLWSTRVLPARQDRAKGDGAPREVEAEMAVAEEAEDRVQQFTLPDPIYRLPASSNCKRQAVQVHEVAVAALAGLAAPQVEVGTNASAAHREVRPGFLVRLESLAPQAIVGQQGQTDLKLEERAITKTYSSKYQP